MQCACVTMSVFMYVCESLQACHCVCVCVCANARHVSMSSMVLLYKLNVYKKRKGDNNLG